MDEIYEPTIYKPNMGETKKKYLQRYTNDEIQRIIENDLKLLEFVLILRETSWSEDLEERSTQDIQISLTLLKSVKPPLRPDVIRWQQKRMDILENITKFQMEAEAISISMPLVRIMGYIVDALFTIGGLYFKKPMNFTLTKLPFLIGIRICTINFEMQDLNEELHKLVTYLKEDQELFLPIENWFHHCEELEGIIENIFPFNSTKDEIKTFLDITEKKRNSYGIGIFSGLLERQLMVKKYSESKTIQNEKTIKNSRPFFSYPSFQKICGRVFYRTRNTILIDAARIILECYYSPLRHFMRQSMQVLTQADQNFYSIYVWGCLFLDGLALIYEFDRLRSFEYREVHHVRHLENHLRREAIALNQIIETFESDDKHH